ncbi:MAG: translation initiation factor IF-3 [Minisyncoccia bacterium]
MREVRLIDENGKQLGIFDIESAMKIADEKNLDLILVSEKAEPPVVKIGDYKKYIYQKEKKEKKKKVSEIKEIRISFQEAKNDLERKAKQVSEFLEEGNQVRIRMILRGRQNLHIDLAKEKLENFLSLISYPLQRVDDIKKTGNNLILIIKRAK